MCAAHPARYDAEYERNMSVMALPICYFIYAPLENCAAG